MACPRENVRVGGIKKVHLWDRDVVLRLIGVAGEGIWGQHTQFQVEMSMMSPNTLPGTPT